MKMFDPVKALVDWGWDEDDAQTIINTLSGSDFIRLSVMLKSGDFQQTKTEINQLLSKYRLPTNESKKPPNIKPRNPFVQNLVNKRAGSHEDKSAKRDPYARKAKHKKPPEPTDINEKEDNMATINEEIARLRKLSGLKEASDTDLQTALEPIDSMSDEGDEDMDLDLENPEIEDPNLGMDSDMEVDPEMDNDMEDPLTAPVEPAPGEMLDTPTKSVAYSLIEEKLNSVQEMLGEINLSEYKMLVGRLSELATQIRIKGTEYLGESRKRK